MLAYWNLKASFNFKKLVSFISRNYVSWQFFNDYLRIFHKFLVPLYSFKKRKRLPKMKFWHLFFYLFSENVFCRCVQIIRNLKVERRSTVWLNKTIVLKENFVTFYKKFWKDFKELLKEMQDGGGIFSPS